jgi:hypothetical protein
LIVARLIFWGVTLLGWGALLAIVLILTSGCAGHEAMRWRKPQPYVETCAVPVCEKINPRDKRCWREYCAL